MQKNNNPLISIKISWSTRKYIHTKRGNTNDIKAKELETLSDESLAAENQKGTCDSEKREEK